MTELHFQNNCEHPRARTHAHEECAILKGPGFAPCHEVLHPDPFYHACVQVINVKKRNVYRFQQDRCRNFGRKPVCDILNAYALECNRANVDGLTWRSKSNCGRSCPSPFIWADCGKPCDETCSDTAPACYGKCVPGCRCPAGLLEVSRFLSLIKCLCFFISTKVTVSKKINVHHTRNQSKKSTTRLSASAGELLSGITRLVA